MKIGEISKIVFRSTITLIIFGVVFYFSSFLNNARAAVPQILSFQGRLTDASGDLRGGNGTNFYFKFAIYDSLTGGTKLWPSGSPASITIKVTQGVFNTLLGDTSAGYEAISLDFDATGYYLEVQASSDDSTFETLTPRQRVVASGFAINAETVHGGRFINATGVGQFGGLATVAYSRFGTDTTTHAGTISGADDLLVSGGLEVNGSAAFDGFVIFGGNASVSGNLELTAGLLKVLKVTSTPQFRVGQSETVYGELYTDSAGDVFISATGGNIRQTDENLWICSGGSCGASAPADNGNVIVETSVIWDNDFKVKNASASATIMYDQGGNAILEFDDKQ